MIAHYFYSLLKNARLTEVVFADGEAWVIRLRTDHVEAPLPSVDMARRLDCEIATMRLLRQCTTIPVPTVFSHSSSSRNELGLPYTVMSAVRGRPPSDLGISRDHPITAEQQEFFARYCTSLADVHVQLSRVRFDRIGSVIASGLNQYTIGPLAEDGTGPFSTAAEYYDARIRAIEAAVLLRGHSAGEEDENRALCLWFYRLAVSTASIEDNHGPFMLTHCDLHLDNTLIDEVCHFRFFRRMISYVTISERRDCRRAGLGRRSVPARGIICRADDRLPGPNRSVSRRARDGPISNLWRLSPGCGSLRHTLRLAFDYTFLGRSLLVDDSAPSFAGELLYAWR